MKTIYEVMMPAANAASHRVFYFSALEDAEKMQDYLNRNLGASSLSSQISERTLFDCFEEMMP